MRLAREAPSGATLSDAWLNTVMAVAAAPQRKLYHVVTHVAGPVQEQPRIRLAADTLLQELGYNSIETVANTIFPAQLAATSQDHRHLVKRYREMYPTLRRLHLNNRHGTYFGRIVAHPTAQGEHDQLGMLIDRLNTERATPGPKGTRYEMNISAPRETSDSTSDPPAAHELTEAVRIYASGQDNSPMSFPCLSFCSFQLDHDTLHLIAHYRRQHLIARGYGNYLGLGRLLGYVCAITGLSAGQMTIVAGVAEVDAAKYRIDWLKARITGA